jgi:hypothetical protein
MLCSLVELCRQSSSKNTYLRYFALFAYFAMMAYMRQASSLARLREILIGPLLPSPPLRSGHAAAPGDDPAVRALADAAVELAVDAAGLEPDEVEELINQFITGGLGARYQQRSGETASQAFAEAAKAALAAEQQLVADRTAERIEAEIDPIAVGEDLHHGREKQGEAEVDEQRERISRLALIEKVKAPWAIALVAMAATSAGVGTLARLSLESVSDSLTRTLLTVAAVATAFATELLVGTLGAETYDRIADPRRRRALLLTLGGVVAVLIGTEVLAAFARQHGVEATNNFKINPATGQPEVGGGLTPSLLWTGPLALLATLSGSGVVGLARLRETSQPIYDGLEAAQARVEDARSALARDEARVKALRERVTASQERAASLRGESDSARAHSEQLLATLDQLSKQHADLIAQITAEALLRYRVAAAAAKRAHKPSAAPEREAAPRSQRRASAILGVAGAAGAVATLASASVLLGALVGSMVLAAGNLR